MDPRTIPPTERDDRGHQEVDYLIVQNEAVSLAQRSFWDFVVAGNNDDRNRWLYPLDCVGDFVACHLGHVVIDKHKGNRAGLGDLHSASRRGGSEYLVS
jgi:hypothetical protein